MFFPVGSVGLNFQAAWLVSAASRQLICHLSLCTKLFLLRVVFAAQLVLGGWELSPFIAYTGK